MNKAAARWWHRLRLGRRLLRGRQQGQSLVIVTVAFIGILAFVGLAIDLGWVYVERVRVAQAADAAALAGASELPLEEAAHTRALVYLQENGYDHTDEPNVALAINGAHQSGPPEEDAPTAIWIDTAYSRDGDDPDTSDRIRVRVRRDVFMTFMQFIGFRFVSVEATAQAENISNIDTVIVYDMSGSMEYDTLCYGCWEPTDAPYPSGDIFPLHWSDSTIAQADHCSSDDRFYQRGGEFFIVIEAEEYSEIRPDYTVGVTQVLTTPYQTFWVMQRNERNEWAYQEGWDDGQVQAMGRDTRGAYLEHHPYLNYEDTDSLGVTCSWGDVTGAGICRTGLPDGAGPFDAPRADYDFYAPRDDQYYFHLRGQGGVSWRDRHVFWGVDGAVMGQESGFTEGPRFDGAAGSRWDWHRLSQGEGGNQGDAVWLSAGTHEFNLWAGGAGFDVDRVIITTSDENPLRDIVQGVSPNNGRTGAACDPCDERFAGRPGGHQWSAEEPYYRPDCGVDLREHAIYDDEQPIRDALEAAKNFVERLNPRLDQVGYVRYSDNAELASELECLRRRGTPNLDAPECNPDLSFPGQEPPCDPDCGCFAEVITNTVLYQLDHTYAGGSTNIAEGIQLGIDALDTADDHYGRPGAAHVIVLLTDGQPRRYPNSGEDGGCYHECCTKDLWPDDTGDSLLNYSADCVVYFAQQAMDENIAIFTISLGRTADQELMKEVADEAGGWHRHAPTPDDLDSIFDELFQRIFLRLIY